ncbi:vWA domain-containing protein [Streptomyces sp. TLI_105]|uniref:vWA domain-containing protein n=1 Tax=Streptomyces sp. TLI_105 TaxID=1881019 RepID=UPI000894CCE5|nr:vWA domain-containing protein [Streptomyces sp. TLI_105]SEB84963.1 von Willebrand factor type A domain-containing protein [Streptomyces sp. TLI_105]
MKLRLDGESSTRSTPTGLVLVLDESGSDGTEWAQLKDFVKSVVNGVAAHGLLTHGGRVGVVGFADGVTPPVSALSGDKDAVLNAIDTNPKRTPALASPAVRRRPTASWGPTTPPATSW